MGKREILKQLGNSVGLLTEDGILTVDRILYDKYRFGNVQLLLKSSTGINIEFIRDKGRTGCCIGLECLPSNELTPIDDVFGFLGVTYSPPSEDMYEKIIYISTIIKHNWVLLQKLSDKNYYTYVKNKLREIRKKEYESLYDNFNE
jgi:hypothetical protein